MTEADNKKPPTKTPTTANFGATITLDKCRELCPDKALSLFNAICDAGKYGTFADPSATTLAMPDDPEAKATIDTAINNFFKQ